ncbi:MBOAT family O-acyltransferase [Cytophagaceae bacterium ABcell3]|nr:MBOAT family O-acyltransferase [Cytophagaceae bacterium ABcell3]
MSYVFYGWWDWRFLLLIFASSLIDFILGSAISKSREKNLRRVYLSLSILFNLGCLGLFKYYNFFIESFVEMTAAFGLQANVTSLSLILPVGISFYTFQTLSYTIDVYRKQIDAVKDPVVFFAFVSFLPQLVAGPIERARNLIPQFQGQKIFDYDKAVNGMRLILWGLFKKVVIADGAALAVERIFSNYESMSVAYLALGAILFAVQIYGDFSGYSDIAIGVAALLGFNLMVNFKTPYFSRDISEFWRRWHISLSTWFRDYLYIPIGGNRGTMLKVVRNTFVIFLVSGFWHGANWTYIFWGGLNALYFLPLLLANRNRKHLDTVAENRYLPSMKEILQMTFTFVLVCFAWIFFRAESLSHAFGYIQGFWANPLWESKLVISVHYFYMLGVFLLIEWLIREKGFSATVADSSVFLRRCTYTMLFLCIVFFGVFNGSEFIYFQF